MKFYKVKVTNVGELLAYTVDGIELNENKGGCCDVMWPNGTITGGVRFHSVEESARYCLTRSYLFINALIQGHSFRIRLEELKIANVIQGRVFL